MWTLLSVALAAPGPDDLRASLDAVAESFAAHAVYDLRFTQRELERAARGEVARRRQRLDGADRVVGVTWTPHDKRDVWLAVQDADHFDMVDGFLEEPLPGSTFQDKVVFQKIDLPWPFADRQWVIRVRNNLALLEATEGAVWERTWDVSPRRGASAEDPKAVWVDVNDGGWLLADCAGGTLLSYHVRTVVGGNVPDEAIVRWSMATLNGLLSGITARAGEIRSHYVDEHAPVRAPDGSEIPRY